MYTIPEPMYREVKSALKTAGRNDLVARLEMQEQLGTLDHEMSVDALTTGQAAAMLGVSSLNTVKNWLEAGEFPGAFKTAGGHWRFLRADVEAVKARMGELREKNRAGDVTPAEHADDYQPPPLL